MAPAMDLASSVRLRRAHAFQHALAFDAWRCLGWSPLASACLTDIESSFGSDRCARRRSTISRRSDPGANAGPLPRGDRARGLGVRCSRPKTLCGPRFPGEDRIFVAPSTCDPTLLAEVRVTRPIATGFGDLLTTLLCNLRGVRAHRRPRIPSSQPRPPSHPKVISTTAMCRATLSRLTTADPPWQTDHKLAVHRVAWACALTNRFLRNSSSAGCPTELDRPPNDLGGLLRSSRTLVVTRHVRSRGGGLMRRVARAEGAASTRLREETSFCHP